MKIINFDEENIEKKKQDKLREIEEENEKRAKNSKRWWLAEWCSIWAAVVLIAVMWVLFVYNVVTVFASVGITILIVVITLLFVFCVADPEILEERKFSSKSIPSVYYAELARENNVLDTRVERLEVNAYLIVTLEDKETHSVSTRKIYFDTDIRTNVGEITVDMENDVIYIPYTKNKSEQE